MLSVFSKPFSGKLSSKFIIKVTIKVLSYHKFIDTLAYKIRMSETVKNLKQVI